MNTLAQYYRTHVRVHTQTARATIGYSCQAHRPSARYSRFQTPVRGAGGLDDDLSHGPCFFEAPRGSRSKTFCGSGATLAARTASGYAVKALGLTARSEERTTELSGRDRAHCSSAINHTNVSRVRARPPRAPRAGLAPHSFKILFIVRQKGEGESGPAPRAPPPAARPRYAIDPASHQMKLIN